MPQYLYKMPNMDWGLTANVDYDIVVAKNTATVFYGVIPEHLEEFVPPSSVEEEAILDENTPLGTRLVVMEWSNDDNYRYSKDVQQWLNKPATVTEIGGGCSVLTFDEPDGDFKSFLPNFGAKIRILPKGETK